MRGDRRRLTAEWIALCSSQLLVLAALVGLSAAQTVERKVIKNPDGSTTHMESSSWGHSTFNQEAADTDGIISGRSGYVDSTGVNLDRHYTVDRNGQRRYIDAKDSKLKGPRPTFTMPNFGPGADDDFLAGRSGFGSLPGFGNVPGFGGNAPGFGGNFPGFGPNRRRN